MVIQRCQRPGLSHTEDRGSKKKDFLTTRSRWSLDKEDQRDGISLFAPGDLPRGKDARLRRTPQRNPHVAVARRPFALVSVEQGKNTPITRVCPAPDRCSRP